MFAGEIWPLSSVATFQGGLFLNSNVQDLLRAHGVLDLG
jgi:hypothetical protein